jgi:hypothetical protein
MLIEKKSQIEKNIKTLTKELEQLTTHLSNVTYTDQDILVIEEFCSKIRDNLDYATFEGKRRIIDLLDVRGTLAVENDEKVIYVKCLISQQRLSLVQTSPL